eukprot:IDg7602t1
MCSTEISVLRSRRASAKISTRTNKATPCTASSALSSHSRKFLSQLISFFLHPGACDISLINRDAGPIANSNYTCCAPLSSIQDSSTPSAISSPTAASITSMKMPAIR